MADVIEARVPAGTHTIGRGRVNTETPKPLQDQGQENPTPPVDLVQFESESIVYGIAWSMKGEFIVTESDDRDSAILKTPGGNLPFRLQRALPYVEIHTPLAGFSLEEVMERLWGCDDLFALRRARSPASTQLKLTADKWMAQVREWASSHPQRDRVVDDSRESIYGDRG